MNIICSCEICSVAGALEIISHRRIGVLQVFFLQLNPYEKFKKSSHLIYGADLSEK